MLEQNKTKQKKMSLICRGKVRLHRGKGGELTLDDQALLSFSSHQIHFQTSLLMHPIVRKVNWPFPIS